MFAWLPMESKINNHANISFHSCDVSFVHFFHSWSSFPLSYTCNKLVRIKFMYVFYNQISISYVHFSYSYASFVNHFIFHKSVHTYLTLNALNDNMFCLCLVYIVAMIIICYWHEVKHILKFWYAFSPSRNQANLFGPRQANLCLRAFRHDKF